MLICGFIILELGCRVDYNVVKKDYGAHMISGSDEYERLREVWNDCSIKQKKKYYY